MRGVWRTAALVLALVVAVVACSSGATQDPQAPARLTFGFAAGTSLKDVIGFIADSFGIGLSLDASFVDAKTSSAIALDSVTLQQALDVVLTANSLFYKVVSAGAILVVADTPQNRQKYEELAIRTFGVSHGDPTEIGSLLSSMLSSLGPKYSRPQIQVNKGASTITVRGSLPLLAIVERLIENTDRPQAEVVIDVEILEIDRSRAKSYGVNLSSFLIGVQYSPNRGGTGAPDPGGLISLDTLLEGVTSADFMGTVPSVVVRFLESDSRTRLLAKPSLRGAEGTKLSANFGDEIPVPSTTFQAVASSAGSANPMTSFTYKSVGINIEVTPRVTYDDDIVLDLLVESSTSGRNVNIAGQELPSFGSRKVRTTMRLRDGESSLLAGLLHDDDRRAIAGIPGSLHVPVVRRLFAANEKGVLQTEIVMLLTPRIIRTRAITERNLAPVVIRQP